MNRSTRISSYALIVDNARILLCRLSTSISPSQEWTLPGGGIEFGEHPHDAAVREVFEETGYRVAVFGRPHLDSEVFADLEPPMHVMRLVYEATLLGGDLRSELNGSTNLCAWFSKHEAEQLPLVSLARLGVRLAFADDTDPGL